jgi:hypothetical protein
MSDESSKPEKAVTNEGRLAEAAAAAAKLKEPFAAAAKLSESFAAATSLEAALAPYWNTFAEQQKQLNRAFEADSWGAIFDKLKLDASKIASAFVDMQRLIGQSDLERLRKSLRLTLLPTSPDTSSRFESENQELRLELQEKTRALLSERSEKEEQAKQLREVSSTLETLRQRESFEFLLKQIHPGARKLLEDSEEFRKQFLDSSSCSGFVLSVDIRRSTDLMLKARAPEAFSQFVSILCRSCAKSSGSRSESSTSSQETASWPFFLSSTAALTPDTMQ